MFFRSSDWIKIFGAREHNLRNINVDIPKNKLVVITGPSGSGKSSLAMDLLYTEGKRRYMESLSAYARQFLGIAKRPDFDKIENLCPTIAIDQKTVGANPRSTVGTITEISDYLRILYAKVGEIYCPDCSAKITEESPDKVTKMLLSVFNKKKLLISAPVAIEKKGEFYNLLSEFYSKGFYKFNIDGRIYKFKILDDIKKLKLKKTVNHNIDILIDSLEICISEKMRLQEAVERSFFLANGICKVVYDGKEFLYSSKRICLKCAKSFPELEPRFFSFNSPLGACKNCHGLGISHEWPWEKDDPNYWKTKYPDFFSKYVKNIVCPECKGKRLNKYSLSVFFKNKNIFEVSNLSIKKCLDFFNNIKINNEVEGRLIKEILARLTFLSNVGLSYLSLNRNASALSGGEGQRIRLASQIGSALSGILYVLDEPSIGLHQRDNDKLIKTLKSLRDHGNTVLVVEHDIDTMKQADYIIDVGPGAGVLGGKIVSFGRPRDISIDDNSITGQYLSGKKKIAVPLKIRRPSDFFIIKNAKKNNLKNIDVKVPLNVFCGISGVSGSGKSTLVFEEIVPFLSKNLRSIKKIENIVVIDQKPIGRTPRSNPATYLGIFDDIRKLFSSLPESNRRGYSPGRFSFNVREGRCFDCNGDGEIKVSMHFLADVSIKCKSCGGKRYNSETLKVYYRNKNIAEILDLTVYEAKEFFAAYKNIVKKLQFLCDVGLSYLKLGQASSTLSGGEAQRIKLVDALSKRGNKTMYILDEPTTGLHNIDIEKLLAVLNRLVDKGNSVIVIEHNLDVLKTVDYLIDLGPEGGDDGGRIVASGSPKSISTCKKSYTALYLKKIFKNK